MIAENLDNFDMKNIFIMQPIKNTLINEGLFHKLLYSNKLFTSNGIYIRIKLIDTKYLNGRLNYDISNNSNILNNIVNIENYILDKVNNNKKLHHKIYDQIKTGNIKVNNSNSEIVLKISGIWENDNSIGISYKIITINKSIQLNSPSLSI